MTYKKYIFDNFITEKFIDVASTKKPDWQTISSIYQAKIKNRSPINTKKDLNNFCRG